MPPLVRLTVKPYAPFMTERKTIQMRVSLYDLPVVFDFIHTVATLCVDRQLNEAELRSNLSEALDRLAEALNPVEDD